MRVLLLILVVLMLSCKGAKEEDPYVKNYTWHPLKVTATAYNSVTWQTNSNPHITAFGDSLKPGMKYIAVSKDLYRLGLKHNTPVKIDGFEGVYLVKDRMHARWKKKIDIYMGLDIKAAKKWGRKKVTIEYGIPKETDTVAK